MKDLCGILNITNVSDVIFPSLLVDSPVSPHHPGLLLLFSPPSVLGLIGEIKSFSVCSMVCVRSFRGVAL